MPFPVSRGNLYSTPCRPLVAMASHGPVSVITAPPLPLTLCFPFPFFKDLCDYIGSTPIIQDDVFISKPLTLSQQGPFCHLKYYIHRFQGLGCRHLWRATILPTTVLSLAPEDSYPPICKLHSPLPIVPHIFNSLHHQHRSKISSKYQLKGP